MKVVNSKVLSFIFFSILLGISSPQVVYCDQTFGLNYLQTIKGSQDNYPIWKKQNQFSAKNNTWNIYPIYGGEMLSIKVDPNNEQIIYVGTRDAGVFKSTDGAQTWQPARQNLTFWPIRSMAIDAMNSNTIYAGTDYDGVWKTTDAGITWSNVSTGLNTGLIVTNIVIDPQNTSHLYASLAGGLGFVIGNIYKSTNGGASWQMKDSGIPRYSGAYTNAIYSLCIDPDSTSVLYAGTHFDGAYKTTNGGESWTAINDSLPQSPPYYETVNALAVDPHHQNRLCALVSGDYYTYENSYWHKISQSYFPNDPISWDFIFFHPTDQMALYTAGNRFTKSTDGGINWTQYLGWNESGHIEDISFHDLFPDIMYAASNILFYYMGGVYKSINQGLTWSLSTDGITATVTSSVAIDPQNTDNIYCGSIYGNLFRTTDSGITWNVTETGGGEINNIAVDPIQPQNIYITSFGLYKSTNYGQTFNVINEVPEAISISINPNASSPVFVGTWLDGIYKSTDAGSSWQQKNNGLPQNGSYFCQILTLAIDPSDTAVVWAGTEQGGIVKSTNGGDSWQIMGLTSEDKVNAIAVNPSNSNEILAGTGNIGNGEIYKSIDGGTN